VSTFSNPVVRGVAPDPSVCRVGNDFFLATSTFEYWPGIPIHHSTDLVHWELIGHAVTRPEQYRPDGGDGPFLLFAPTLRYSDGTFYLACANMAPARPDPSWRQDGLSWFGPKVGNFVVRTDDPAGEWSDAAWVDAEAFDPSLLFADGTCYYTRRTLDFGNPAGHGPIVQAEIDPTSGRLAAAPRPITPGVTGFCSNDIEGPHLYKIGDWYYLFSAEGGTEQGHMQTCARSRSPWGPWEPAPHNPVLTHRHRQGHPIQRTGHAELVEAPDGTWWALFLGTRPVPMGPGILGRETFLAPVEWRDGWPVIGHEGVVEMEMPAPSLPRSPGRAPTGSPWLAGWSTRHFPVDGLRIDGDRIELPALPVSLDEHGEVSAAFLRQQEHAASFRATLDAVPDGATAGITAYTGPEHHYDLVVSRADGWRRVVLRRRAADLVVEEAVSVPAEGPVELSVETAGGSYRFTARAGNETVTVGAGAARLLDPDLSPGFGSVRLGVVATGPADGHARFSAVGGEHVG
jgi:alpha-N-arabinofuranosidase